VALSTYEFIVRCSAPADVVFDVLADATRWKDWAGMTVGVSEWDREGVPAPGGVGAVRKLGRWPLFTREQITEYDPPRHLGYTILSGMPVRGYHADIDLSLDTTDTTDTTGTTGTAGTAIRWAGAFEPTVPGTGTALETLLERVVLGYARGAAREAERRAR
jgi:Polyketide cyclase / dehydrase and lipid transport